MADKLIIRTSDRGTFKRCRQLWDFTSKIRQDYESLRPKDYFEFGTAWHAAMEEWYRPENEQFTLPFLDAGREAEARQAFVYTNMSQRRGLEELGFGGVDLEKEYKEREELGQNMLSYYFGWSRLYDDFEPITVEHEFEVPIIARNGHPLVWCIQHNRPDAHDIEFVDDKPIMYQGRIDGLVREPNGNYWLLEHKTASKEGGTNWLQMDEQTGSYLAAFRQLGVHIYGVIRTTAYKRYPVRPKTLKDGSVSVDRRQSTTASLFLEAIEDAYGFQPAYNTITEVDKYLEYHQFLTGEAAPQFIVRSKLARSHEQIEDIGRRIALEAEDMLSNPHIYPNVSPMNCNPCAFFGPCLAKQDGSDWEYILKSEFRKRNG